MVVARCKTRDLPRKQTAGIFVLPAAQATSGFQAPSLGAPTGIAAELSNRGSAACGGPAQMRNLEHRPAPLPG